MLPDYTLIAWLVISFAVYLTGVSKGGFAGGFGTLSVPLMALVISPTHAAGLLLPLLLVMDVFAVKAWLGKHEGSSLVQKQENPAKSGVFKHTISVSWVPTARCCWRSVSRYGTKSCRR